MHAVAYALWLIKEIFVAGFTLAMSAFKPDNEYHPVIIRYPLRVTSAWEIFWFTSSITATPWHAVVGTARTTAQGLAPHRASTSGTGFRSCGDRG